MRRCWRAEGDAVVYQELQLSFESKLRRQLGATCSRSLSSSRSPRLKRTAEASPGFIKASRKRESQKKSSRPDFTFVRSAHYE